MSEDGAGEQLALLRETVRRAPPPRRAPQPAAVDPVARVAVEVGLAHLDRPFDYLVTEAQSAAAQPGVRVRVRFAGQLVDGFVLERVARSEHTGRLSPLSRVVSPEPVLTPALRRLASAVAERYAGSVADVLRLAVPPRHASVEAEPGPLPSPPPPRPAAGEWQRYPGGPAFLDALADGRAPRAVWAALPRAGAGGSGSARAGSDRAGSDPLGSSGTGPSRTGVSRPESVIAAQGGWPAALAVAVRTATSAGRGALVVLPDGRDVDLLDAALAALAHADGSGRSDHVVLTADLGPRERYRRWLAVRRGQVRAVIGTRAATFAPVADLGLVALWDDGDDLHAEPHAPYPHVREVLCLRAEQEGAAALVGGVAVTAEGASLVRAGWARPLRADRAVVRRAAPRVEAVSDDVTDRDSAAGRARLPTLAWEVARSALARGPVLVQVPRAGYVPAVACATCRSRARCPACAGPLGLGGRSGPPRCQWCGEVAGEWRCPECGDARLRATAVGSGRTAEELGRAFPGAVVRESGAPRVLAHVPDEPALIVATPGAEPVADGGYAAALLLDAWTLLGRPGLRAGEEALRRWFTAAALVRPASDGGRVVVLAGTELPPVQALVRWDPFGFAERELADRAELGFPPAVRVAAVDGPTGAVAELLRDADLSAATVLGPVPTGPETAQVLLRAPRRDGLRLAAALHAAQAARSARKAPPVRIRVDPVDLG